MSIADISGLVHTLTYSDATTPPAIAPAPGLLIAVTDSFGRQLQYIYNSRGRVIQITDPNGGVCGYAYDNGVHNGVFDGVDNLLAVAYPDGKTRTYHFEDASYLHALTGISDENQSRFSTYAYQNQYGMYVLSSEHAGGVNKYSFNFYYSPNRTTVIDPLGISRTYNFLKVAGVPSPSSEVRPCSTPGCSGLEANSTTYDTNGNVASRTDFKGNRTNYTYDLTRNLETSRTEGLTAAGTTTPQSRTIATTWHPTFRIPATITEPTTAGNKVTTFGHDANGNVLSKSVTVGGLTRTWTYTYDPFGRVLTATDPLNHTTTNTYYPNDAAQGLNRGMLATVSNAAAHTTTITSYNAHGQPLSITDANGLVTDMVYDARQRLTSHRRRRSHALRLRRRRPAHQGHAPR
ncbi:MAG: RHS repeat protein [Betaproteobacteria bacterium]|nr:RHS repeat protein [Betaproteobacteria bacterium]